MTLDELFGYVDNEDVEEILKAFEIVSFQKDVCRVYGVRGGCLAIHEKIKHKCLKVK